LLTRKIFVFFKLRQVWLGGVLYIAGDLSQHYLVFISAAIAFFFGLLLRQALRLKVVIVLGVLGGGNFFMALFRSPRFGSRVWNLIIFMTDREN
jgi:hypothetical protein